MPDDVYSGASQEKVVFRNGPTIVETRVVDNGDLVSSPPDIDSLGYVLIGWFTDEYKTQAWDFSADIVSDSTTLFAGWQPSAYFVSYHGNGATYGYMEPRRYVYGIMDTLNTNEYVRTGSNFLGWSTLPNANTPSFFDGQLIINLASANNDTVVLYAVWKAIAYRIRFIPNGGNGYMNDLKMFYGVDKTLPANIFTRSGYEFVGWSVRSIGGAQTFPDEGIISGTIAQDEDSTVLLYAQWSGTFYRLYFDAQGGMFTSVKDSSKEVTYNAELGVLPVPVRFGFGFNGWYKSPFGQGEHYNSASIYNKEGDDTVYAFWWFGMVTVNFECNGGTGVSPVALPYGSYVTPPPPPARPGYTFGGWYKDLALTTVWNFGIDIVWFNTTLYAKWSTRQYYVQYLPNAGTGVVEGANMAVEHHTYDSSFALSPLTYTRTGYNFSGWATSASGYVLYADKDSVKNLSIQNGDTAKLYAQWAAKTCVIVFDVNLNGGFIDIVPELLGVDTLRIRYDHPLVGVPSARRDGYHFMGWYTNQTGVGNVYTESMILQDTGTLILYAYWQILPAGIPVNFDAQGGTITGNTTILTTIGSVVHSLSYISYNTSVPVRRGYTFEGYYSQPLGQGAAYFDRHGNPAPAGRVWDKGVEFTLYARWEPNPYKVEYIANGADNDGVMTGGSVHLYDLTQSLRVNTYTRTGYRFAGWDTLLAGKQVVYTDAMNVVNLSADSGSTRALYAVWIGNRYTVHYMASGGIGDMRDQTLIYDSMQRLSPNGYVRQGYDFMGWHTDSMGEVGIGYSDEQLGKHNITTQADEVILLYAQWQAVHYTLYFDEEGGTLSGATSKIVCFDSVVGDLPVPTRSGYGFNGWYSEPVGYGTRYTSGTKYRNPETTTLYAYWLGNTHTVIFNLNGGVGVSPIAIPDGTIIPEPTVIPTKDGYHFAGWYVEANCSTQWDFATGMMSNRDTSIYAKWDENNYVVRFVKNGVNVTGEMPYQNFNYTIKDTLRENRYVNEGYDFAGWSLRSAGLILYLDGDSARALAQGHLDTVDLYAQWSANTYKLIFHVNDGNIAPLAEMMGADTMVITYGKPLGRMPSVLRPGYAFKGWWSNNDGTGTLYDNTQLCLSTDAEQHAYAWWSDSLGVVVTLNGQGATNPGTTLIEDIRINTPVSGFDVAPQRTGYVFLGYYSEPNGAGKCYFDASRQGIGFWDKTDNFTLYANWKPVRYTVHYNPNGIGAVGLAGVEDYSAHIYDSLKFLRTGLYTREGYSFAGWTQNQATTIVEYREGQNVMNLTVTDNDTVELYAVWSAYVYTLHYVAMGGVGDMSDQIMMYGNKRRLNPCTFSRVGHEFMGWVTGDIIEQSFNDRDSVLNLTNVNDTIINFYAKWNAKYYTLYFEVEGGTMSGGTSKTVRYDSIVGDLPLPTRLGYGFNGWYSEPNGFGTRYTSGTLCQMTDDDTLYAQWSNNTHTVNFDLAGGVGVSPVAVPDNTPVDRPLLNPVRSGYTFLDWYKNDLLTTWDFLANITKDTSIYAKWQAKEIIMQFDKGHPDADSIAFVNPITIIYGVNTTLAQGYSLHGYTFVGWLYTNPLLAPILDGKTSILYNYEMPFELSAAIFDVVSPLPQKFVAQWKPNSYRLAFDVNKGIGSTDPTLLGDTMNVLYDSPLGRVPEAQRVGYVFDGWYENSNGTGKRYADTTVWRSESALTTVYAQWLPAIGAIRVTLDGQGATTAGTTYIDATLDSAVNGLNTLPARQYHTFAGYYDQPNGQGKKYFDSLGVGQGLWDKTYAFVLFAYWRPIQYKVTFNGNGSSYGSMVADEALHTYNVEVVLPTNKYLKASHSFLGWSTSNTATSPSYLDGQKVINIGSTTSDVILYAVWATGYSRTITFDANKVKGSSSTPVIGIHTTLIVPGYQLGVLPTAICNGYSLLGWYDDSINGQLYTSTTVWDKESDTLYAHWTAKKYDVVLDKQGGTGVPAYVTATFDSAMPAMTNAVPERIGYTFNGYYDVPGDTTSGVKYYAYSNKDLVSAHSWNKWDTTARLYAHWEANHYIVLYDMDTVGADISTMATQVMRYDSLSELRLNSYTRIGYGFGGWATASQQTTITYRDGERVMNLHHQAGDTIRLYAVWLSSGYRVHFNANLGMGDMQDQYMLYDVVLPLSTNTFTRAGFTFIDWDTDSLGRRDHVFANNESVSNLTNVQDSVITLYAQWNARYYTLYFDSAGTVIGSKSVRYDSAIGAMPTCIRPDMGFKGWCSDSGCVGTTYFGTTPYKTDGDDTVYACWLNSTAYWTVTYDCQGGYGPNTDAIENGRLIDPPPPPPARPGWSFKGWHTAPDSLSPTWKMPTDKVYSNMTLYAVWQENNYSVRFIGNGHTAGSMPDQNFSYTQQDTLYSIGYTRTGYEFIGWSLLPGGRIIYGDNEQVKGLLEAADDMLILYAQWRAKTYLLRLVGNKPAYGTTGIEVELDVNVVEVTYDQKTGLLPIGRLKGHLFNAWYTKASAPETGCTGTQFDSATIWLYPQDTTGYACWSRGVYTVTLDKQGGTGGYASIMPSFGALMPNSGSKPTKTGYTFLGYFDAPIDGIQYYDQNAGVGYFRFWDKGENTTLYAHWLAHNYVIAFYGNHENVEGSMPRQHVTVDHPTPLDSNNYTLEGKIFVGWSQDSTATKATFVDHETILNLTTVNSDTIRLYAVWTSLYYSVVLKPCGGSGGTTEIQTPHGGLMPDGKNAPYRSGYTFLGYWDNQDYLGDAYYDSVMQGLRYWDKTSATADTLYAKWNPNTYVITFNAQGGSSYAGYSMSILYDHKIIDDLMPTLRSGYRFGGWYTPAEGFSGLGYEIKKNDTFRIANNVTLLAYWIPYEYVVQFKEHGVGVVGSMTDQNFVYGQPQYLQLNRYERIGYQSNGWSTIIGDTTPQIANGALLDTLMLRPKDTLTLYVVWKPFATILNLDSTGGYGGTPSVWAVYGDLLPEDIVVAPQKKGYVFDGFYDAEVNGTQYYSATMQALQAWDKTTVAPVLYARWMPQYNQIRYELYGGTTNLNIDENNVPSGAHPNPTENPTRSGYRFQGWSLTPAANPPMNSAINAAGALAIIVTPANIDVCSDTVLYAVWLNNQYLIHYVANGGSGDMVDQPMTYDYIYQLNTNNYSRLGYTLKEWNTVANGSGSAFLNQEYPVLNIVNTHDTTVSLYAQWQPNHYLLSFDVGASSSGGTPASRTVCYDSVVGALPIPVNLGYGFNGWYTNLITVDGALQGAGTRYMDTSIYRETDAITLHAWWIAGYFTVYFNTNGGVVSYPVAMPAGNGVLPIANPTRQGYDFEGWYHDNETFSHKWLFAGDISGVADTIRQDSTIHTKWIAHTYTVAYHGNTANNEGIMTASNNVLYGSKIELKANAYVKTGYHFKAWNRAIGGGIESYGDKDSVSNLVSAQGDTAHLYAQWEGNLYKLRFNSNATTGYQPTVTMSRDSQYVRFNARVDSLPIASRAGYRFEGWHRNANGTGGALYSILNTYNDAGDLTLFAQWSPIGFTLSYSTNGGSKLADTVVLFGNSLNPPSPTRLGYNFAGWCSDAATLDTIDFLYYRVLNSAILYAAWRPITYYVRYYANRSAATDTTYPSTHRYNESKSLNLNGFKLQDYTFMSWSLQPIGNMLAYINGGSVLNLTNQNNDTVPLYALWGLTSNLRKLYFNSRGGNTNGVDSVYVIYGSPVGPIPTAVRKGYTFQGWFADSLTWVTQYDENVIFTQNTDVTLYAKWQVNRYLVSFDKQGGNNGLFEIMATFDSLMPDGGIPPERAGYAFMGYYDGTDSAHATQYYSNQMRAFGGKTWDKPFESTLYAVWRRNEYYIQYVKNSAFATGTMPNQTILYGTMINLDSNQFNYKGYTFRGWGITATTTKVSYPDAVPIFNLTNVLHEVVQMFAVWKPNDYFINMNERRGSGGTLVIHVVYDEDMPSGMTAPSRPGYRFKGYYDDTVAGVCYYNDLMTSQRTWDKDSAKPLYAQWEAISYTLTFNDRNGSGVTNIKLQVFFDQPVVGIPIVAVPGYDLLGWFTQRNEQIAEGELYKIAADDSVTARWSAWTYTIAFVDYTSPTTDYTSMGTQSFTYGQPQYLRMNMYAQYGRAFVGWGDALMGPLKFTNGQLIDTLPSVNNQTFWFHALWKASEFKVVLDKKGGVGGSDTITATYGQLLETGVKAPTRRGYEFNGYRNREGTTVYYNAYMRPIERWYNVDPSPVLNAIWHPLDNRVTFETYGGTTIASDTITSGASPEIQVDMVRNGYSLLGWSLNPIDSGSLINPNGTSILQLSEIIVDTSMTIYAVWQSNNYTVRFLSGGNVTGNMDLQVHYYGRSQPLSPDLYYMKGYSFGSWNTQEDGQGESFADQQAVINLTNVQDTIIELHAQWVIDTYNVVYYAASDGSVVYSTEKVTYNDTAPFIKAERKGYEFIRWRLNTGQYWDFHYDNINQDTALYAEWERLPATLDILNVYIGSSIVDIGFSKDIKHYRIILPCDTSPIRFDAYSNDSYLAYYWEGNPTLTTVVTAPDPHDYTFVIQAFIPGFQANDYTIELVRRYDANVIVRYRSNILAVNLNSVINGGYEFIAYEWYRDGNATGIVEPYLYLDKLDTGEVMSSYSVYLQTRTQSMMSCELRNIQAVQTVELNVYPNPVTNGYTTVDYEAMSVGDKIKVYDMNSILRREFIATGKRTSIDLSGLSKGAYILSVGDKSVTVIIR
ncbi:hypothetical protein FACS1894201_00130 [Bacteroidia bacterium]|nr:hypothetical protein FACS1894201_00130 [Bacteroidia bacterium]